MDNSERDIWALQGDTEEIQAEPEVKPTGRSCPCKSPTAEPGAHWLPASAIRLASWAGIVKQLKEGAAGLTITFTISGEYKCNNLRKVQLA